jgi:hypothetical protein
MPSHKNKPGSYPFSRIEGSDIILKSSDDVLFYVSRAILVEASPFFCDMFSLEQPSAASEANPVVSPEPIPFPEKSDTVNLLLCLCYDLSDTTGKDIPTIGQVLEVARKYEVNKAVEAARNWIWSHVPNKPLQVYALACRLNLEQEATGAAAAWKTRYLKKFSRSDSTFEFSVEGASYIPEMDDISSGAYFRLLQFMNAPVNTVDHRPFSFCRPQFASRYRNAQKHVEQPVREIPDTIIPQAYGQPVDFVLKSTDGVEFRVHRLILELAGGQKLLACAAEHASDGLPLSRVGTIGWVLAKVVQLCYPLGTPGVFQDLPAVQEILRFAAKYNMIPLIEIAKAQLMQIVESTPLRIYLIVAENGWLPEAEKAARALALHHLKDQYAPEMEDVSARAYYRLLRYHNECRAAINRVASRHSDYVQGWRKVSQSRQKNLAALSIPLPIVEMWTEKLLAAQCPSPNAHKVVSTTKKKKGKERSSDDSDTLLWVDLQRDFVDATHAMEMEIKEELLKVSRYNL